VPGRKRLLFVDDELGIRNTLPVVLRRHGFSVSVASTVKQALDQIRDHEFDLLLCDLNIERGADGYDVVRAMREAKPDCVVVVLTGYPALETAIEGIHLAIDDYIVKPAKTDELVAHLAERLVAREAKPRILTASYYGPLLQTWTLLLRAKGYEVTPAREFAKAMEQCKNASFDLLLLGSSVPLSEKRKIIEAARRNSSAPIISVPFKAGEEEDGADFHLEPDPESLLRTIDELTRRRGQPTPVGLSGKRRKPLSTQKVKKRLTAKGAENPKKGREEK